MYVHVDVAVRLSLRPAADRAAVASEAERLIRGRLWDIATPELPDVTPWPPGRPLGAGEIRGLLGRLPEVEAILDCTLTAADGRLPDEKTGLIGLRDREIALAREVRIKIGGAP
jgi:hypothetical protein